MRAEPAASGQLQASSEAAVMQKISNTKEMGKKVKKKEKAQMPYIEFEHELR